MTKQEIVKQAVNLLDEHQFKHFYANFLAPKSWQRAQCAHGEMK